MSGERRLTGRPIQRRTEPRPFADSEDDVAAMIAATDTAGMREALAEALRDELVRLDEWPTGLELADVLLPVVQDLAAEELRAAYRAVIAGELMDLTPEARRRVIDWLEHRADTRAAAAQPTEED